MTFSFPLIFNILFCVIFFFLWLDLSTYRWKKERNKYQTLKSERKQTNKNKKKQKQNCIIQSKCANEAESRWRKQNIFIYLQILLTSFLLHFWNRRSLFFLSNFALFFFLLFFYFYWSIRKLSRARVKRVKERKWELPDKTEVKGKRQFLKPVSRVSFRGMDLSTS